MHVRCVGPTCIAARAHQHGEEEGDDQVLCAGSPCIGPGAVLGQEGAASLHAHL